MCRRDINIGVRLGYCLLGMLSTFGFRAVRESLPNDPVAQERIIGAALKALAIGDVCPLVAPIRMISDNLGR
jgi:hypothetical protein